MIRKVAEEIVNELSKKTRPYQMDVDAVEEILENHFNTNRLIQISHYGGKMWGLDGLGRVWSNTYGYDNWKLINKGILDENETE